MVISVVSAHSTGTSQPVFIAGSKTGSRGSRSLLGRVHCCTSYWAFIRRNHAFVELCTGHLLEWHFKQYFT